MALFALKLALAVALVAAVAIVVGLLAVALLHTWPDERGHED